MSIKNRIVVLLALIVIIFGIAGCLPCVGGIYFTSRINFKNPGSSYFINSMSSSIKSVNVLLDDSAVALNNVADTVQEAEVSLADASVMLKNSSIALSEVSELMEFEILGLKPLGGVSVYFKTISDDTGKLSDSILEMSQSIGTNIEDINKISTDVTKISTDLDSFSSSFSTTTSLLPDFNIKIILYIVFIYLGILNLLFILIGLSLLALSRQTISIRS